MAAASVDLTAAGRRLEEERAHTRELLTAVQWARMKDRFHAFDGIKNDSCPSCGGRVKVMDDSNALRIEAIGREDVSKMIAENKRLREGLESALRYMQEGRRSVAINVLKGVISGDTW